MPVCRLLTILIILLTLNSVKAQLSYKNIELISLSFTHSRRIPYNYVSVTLTHSPANGQYFAKVESKPMNNDPNWAYSKMDTTCTIDSTRFTALAEKVILLLKMDLSKALEPGLLGNDGTYCSISFGTFTGSIVFGFWSPDYNTKQRGLDFFLDLCRQILYIGRLDPEKIL